MLAKISEFTVVYSLKYTADDNLCSKLNLGLIKGGTSCVDLLWGFSALCFYAFVRVYLFVPFGHLLGEG